MRRFLTLALAATIALLQLAGCDLGSFGFEGNDVCDDLACAWELEQGALERTGSWNSKEYAFSFVGTPTRLGRRVNVATSPECVRFSYVGDIDEGAGLELQLDFADDGSIDAVAPLPAIKWKHHTLVMRAPADFRQLRVHLQKSGTGTAKLAQVIIEGGEQDCAALPPVVLQNGAACTLDSTCASSRCVLGHCAACGAGGCAEGESCRNDSECADGACAATVCRACAKRGSCGAGERCSTASQCASQTCTFGSVPSMSSHPQLDGSCGECKQSSDCNAASGGKACLLGRCVECTNDSDCASGSACRYLDLFDALHRSCVPKLTSQLPRGALCEGDADCGMGLRCGGGVGRAKRCGFACSEGECAAGEVCIVPGAKLVSSMPGSESYALLSSYSELAARIATCYPSVAAAVHFGSPHCELAQQCVPASPSAACCHGFCSTGESDLSTGVCLTYPRGI